MAIAFSEGYHYAYDENGFALILWAQPLFRKADGLAPGERWITLKPHGPDHEAYVHVKIRENPDGSAHIINGPKAITGLHLRKLGTRADWEARKKQPPKLDPEEIARRAQEAKELEPQIAQARQQALQAAAQLTESEAFTKLLDPELKDKIKGLATSSVSGTGSDEGAEKMAGGMAAAAAVRSVEGAVKQLQKHLIRTLVQDDELRSAVLSGQELQPPEPSTPRKTTGYQRNLKEEAAAQGFGAAQARKEANDFFAQRYQEALDTDPEKAQRMLKARQRMLEAQAIRPDATAAAKEALSRPETKIDPETIKAKAEAVKTFLQANQKLKILREQQRRVALGKDPTVPREVLEELGKPPTGAPFELYPLEAEAQKELAENIEALKREDLMKTALGTFEKTADGLSYKALRDSVHAAHAAGAYAHLSNVGLAALGDDLIDRTVLDQFGGEAAAVLVAEALRSRLPQGQIEAIRKALEDEHQAHLEALPAAIEKAEALYKQAQAIQIPAISDAVDGLGVEELLHSRKEALQEARDVLGAALGRVEASAALNMALMQPERNELTVNMGPKSVRDVAPVLRALGLPEGSYRYDKQGDQLTVTLNKDGMKALTAGQPPELAELRQRVAAIKAGAEDEDDYLPPNFARYPSSAFDTDPPKPERFAVEPGFRPGRNVREALEEAIASRLADGWTPAEVQRLLRSVGFKGDWVPPEQQAEYEEHLRELLPAYDGEEIRTNQKGEQYRVKKPVDYDNLEAKHPHIAQALKEHTERWMAQHRPGKRAYGDQTLEDTPETRKALYMALVSDPRLQVAHKPLGDLTSKDQQAIRHYYLTEVLGKTPEQLAERKQAVKEALEAHDRAHPEPPKFGNGNQGNMFWGEDELDDSKPVTLTFAKRGGAFAADDELRKAEAIRSMGLGKGDYVENQDGSITLTESGKRNVRPSASMAEIVEGLRLNPDWRAWHGSRQRVAAQAAGNDLVEWADFVETMKGPHRAYTAIQEHMRGALAQRFAQHHAAITGKPLKAGKKANPWGDVLWQIRDPEGFARFQQSVQQEAAQLRQREGGKFAYMGGTGALLEAYRAKKEAKKAAQAAQSSLFAGMGDPALEADPIVPNLERYALPEGVERRLGAMMGAIARPVRPLQNPVQLIPDRTMGKGTKYVKQQRAIKHLLAAKKTGLFLGTGSGKSSTMIGMGTELLHRGEAKKVLMGVPSVVRDQMGEEMAMTLEPGKYNWHAQEAPFEERRAAYRDPNTHFVAVTHQSLRDDLLRIMAEHHGQEPGAFTQRFVAAPLEERQQMMKKALEAEGIPLDFLAFDEAHDFLGRDGKPDSIMQRVFDTAMSLAKYGTYATGSPLKNDMSEIADWLAKLDPQNYGDKDAFMRRYGMDAKASREAVKRLTDPHFFVDAVPSGTQKRVVWGADGTTGSSPSGHAYIPLHPAQQQAMEALDQAHRRLMRAQRQGKVDVEAAKHLSPESFEGQDSEHHETIAKRIQENIGIMRHAAEQRIINQMPPEQNAKIEHLIKLVNARKGQGTVIFAHNRAAVDMIAHTLEAQGHKVAVLHGGHSGKDKTHIRNRFKRGEVDVIVSSDAGQVGANLQHRGQHMIHYDVPMTQKSWEQRSARIDRLGQSKPIEIHTLLTDSDHDRENYDRIAHKKMLGSIFQGVHESLDETGLALRIKLAQLHQDGKEPT